MLNVKLQQNIAFLFYGINIVVLLHLIHMNMIQILVAFRVSNRTCGNFLFKFIAFISSIMPPKYLHEMFFLYKRLKYSVN